MAGSRLDIYNSDDVQNRVANALRDMRELKHAQFIGGDSIRFYRRDTGNEYDWGGVPPASVQAVTSSLKILRVRATAKTQNVLFADIIVEQRIDSPTANPHTILDYLNELQAGVNDFNLGVYPDAQMPGEANVQSWTIGLGANNPNGTPRPMNVQYMKCYIVSNDDVDIEILELN